MKRHPPPDIVERMFFKIHVCVHAPPYIVKSRQSDQSHAPPDIVEIMVSGISVYGKQVYG